MFDTENQNCAFAEQTVGFLYGELETASREQFETHLQTCAACADELDGFKAVRYSILDWRALEFDSLRTPAIDIGARNSIERAAPISQKTDSWLDGLRKIFSPSRAFAFAATLIFTAICVALVAYNFSGGQQIAETDKEKSRVKTEDLTKQSNANQTLLSEKDDDENEKQYAAEKTPASKSFVVGNDSARKTETRQTIKAANGERVFAEKKSIAKKIYNASPNRKISDSGEFVAKNNLTTKKQTALKLSSIEDEEEDASLRLTDLLDDAGGK